MVDSSKWAECGVADRRDHVKANTSGGQIVQAMLADGQCRERCFVHGFATKKDPAVFAVAGATPAGRTEECKVVLSCCSMFACFGVAIAYTCTVEGELIVLAFFG